MALCDCKQTFAQSFYLNYVGCKVLIHIIPHKKQKSFTLTMWDVKSLNHDFLGVGEWGFTLTMWDVKQVFHHVIVVFHVVLP